MAISEKLRSLRKVKGYSQEFLAEKCGVSRQAISKWETGIAYPEMDKLIGLSKIYDVSIDYLVKDEGGEKNQLDGIIKETEESDSSLYNGKICDITLKSFMKILYRNVKVISCDEKYIFFINKGKKGIVNRGFVHCIMVKNKSREIEIENNITYDTNLLKNMMGKCNIYANPNGYLGGAAYLFAEIQEVEGNIIKVSVGKNECLMNIDEVSSIVER